jgi:ribose transport system permease protein
VKAREEAESAKLTALDAAVDRAGSRPDRAVPVILELAAAAWIRMGTLLMLFALAALFAALNPRFLNPANLTNIALQSSVNCMLAIGMTFVIIGVGIDLSVGSILACAGTLAVGLYFSGMPEWLAILVGLAVGALFGAANGWLIGKWRISFFVVTLGMMSIARGIAYVYTGGRPITVLESRIFTALGAGYLGPVPVPVLTSVILLAVAWYLQNHTVMGRNIFLVGGNEEAARLSGVNVDNTRVLVYSISGFLSGAAGITLVGRLASAQPMAGVGYELDAIAAVVLGGTPFAGGSGSVVGSAIGALLLGTLTNGMNILNVDYYYQLIVKGAILIAAFAIDRFRTGQT